MRRHPLLDVVEEIDPQESYTARDVAGLTRASPHTVRKWAAGGHLGAGSWEGIGTDASGAARRRVWTGAELIRSVTSPRPVQDHEGRTDATTWAQGCRAGDGCTCANEHSARTTAARRRAADDRFPAAVRDDVLRRAARGATPKQAARAAGVPVERIWSYARSHPEWLARLDEALMAGSDPLLRHGREHTYRMGCHCPQCRAAKAARRGEKRKRPSAERAGQP